MMAYNSEPPADSRAGKARVIVQRFAKMYGGLRCPICAVAHCDLIYHTELTARWRCQSVHGHSFSIAISVLKGELPQ